MRPIRAPTLPTAEAEYEASTGHAVDEQEVAEHVHHPLNLILVADLKREVVYSPCFCLDSDRAVCISSLLFNLVPSVVSSLLLLVQATKEAHMKSGVSNGFLKPRKAQKADKGK
jgi:hypothetical protein